MAVGDRNDPYRAQNFRVEIDGITRAGFRECSGLGTTQALVDYREGTDLATNRRLPGLVTYTNIVLKWGTSDDEELRRWRQRVVAGMTERKNGSVVLVDSEGTEKLRWNFVNGWPIKWTGPTLNAAGNDVAIETLEIAHEGITEA